MKVSSCALVVCLSALLCGRTCTVRAAEQPQKIAILPLTAGGQEDINYIAEGLRDMIASRVASGTGLAVIEQGAVKAQYAGGGKEAPSLDKVRSTGKALGADYVLFGSVAKMGDELLIAINMLSVPGDAPSIPVFAQNLGMNEVIPRMQLIAQEVRGAVEDGMLAPESNLPSPAEPVLQEKTENAKAASEGRVGPDPSIDSDEPLKPGTTEPDDVQADDAGREEEEAEAAGEAEEGKGGLGDVLFKRKGDIKSPPENPVYEKSVDEMQDAAKPQP